MAKAWKPENTSTYTYESVDGSTFTIHAGEEGISEELILFLKADDNQMELNDRYERDHTDYSFMLRMRDYERNPDNERGNPFYEFQDEDADIMKILFPDQANDSSMLTKLQQAVALLTKGQQDLIYELFGLCKTMTDVAREQHVSLTAIQNRRNKLLKRVKKLIADCEL